MSQPIISDYLRMKSLNQSVALRTTKNGYMSDEDIIGYLSDGKKYGNTPIQAPTGGPMQFTLGQLKSMVGKKLKSGRFGARLEPGSNCEHTSPTRNRADPRSKDAGPTVR